MAFIQTNVNYATQYARELANAYAYLNYFGAIYGAENSTRYRPINGKTVAIPSLDVSGATAVNRDQITGVFNRNWNNEWQNVTLTMDREWSTIIDPMDIVETNDVATIANVTRTFNELQKTPEMDAYAASKLAGFANAAGGIDTTTLTAANILAQWDSYLAYMTGRRVNRDRLVAYMTPTTYKLLKQAAGITRFIDSGTGIRNIDRNVGKLDGVAIFEVPPDIMKTAFDFTTGWVPSASAGNINMLLVDPMAIAAPVVYDVSMISAPTAQSKGKYLYYERYYYDVFALNQRTAGLFVNLSAAAALNTLTVTSEAGTAAGDSAISVTAGAKGYSTSAFYYVAGASVVVPTAGTAIALSGSGAYTKLSDGVPAKVQVDELTAAQTIQVVEVNADTLMPIGYGTATIVVNS